MSQPSIAVINPKVDTPGYHGADFIADWGFPGHVSVADLSTVTVAALVPPDWEVTVVDESIEPARFAAAPDFVAITGKMSQRRRMIALAEEWRRRGSIVLIGGPYASLNPDDMRRHADILVTGEIEEIAADLFADLKEGRWRDVYTGTQPDLRLSPVPRWDLYPKGRAALGSVQTSRGCPFECEFCDVIQYMGRKQRHKEPEQVIRELAVLRRAGYRQVFLADDNFTVYRKRATRLLAALKTWNDSLGADRMRFFTQTSIDVARDDELLDLCRAAGIEVFYIGVETINEDSLREAQKRQNLLQDIEGALANILGRGISILAGIIVGFDHDGLDIFDRQYDFIQRSGVVDLSIGALVAPYATPLYARLKREGRLREDNELVLQSPWHSNIEPRLMTRDELAAGLGDLCQRIYAPEAFQERFDRFLKLFGAHVRSADSPANLSLGPIADMVAKKVAAMGPREAIMIDHAMGRLRERPDAVASFADYIFRYAQARHVLRTQGGEQSRGNRLTARRRAWGPSAPLIALTPSEA